MVAAPCIGIVKKFSSQAKSRALAKARLMNWSSPVAQWVGAKPKLGLMRSPGVPWKLFPLISCLMNVRHQAD